MLEHQFGEWLEIVLGQVLSIGHVKVHVKPVGKLNLKEKPYDVISLFVWQVYDEATF